MDKICIIGGTPLTGTINICGAKNAALPLMAASLLSDNAVILSNVPSLADISSMKSLLSHLGVNVHTTGHGNENTPDGGVFSMAADGILKRTAPYEIVRKMRASILVLGPLLARLGEAYVSLPGGCAIGTRPINLHLDGLKAFGADVSLENGYIHAQAPKGLTGGRYTFPTVSVTGTENLLMAASICPYEFEILNAAHEPEVTDLANMLVKMGAKIEGIGTDTLHVYGTQTPKSVTHSIGPDRIETGTYAIAAAITGGTITLNNTNINLLPAFKETLEKTGTQLEQENDSLHVQGPDRIESADIITMPYPGYPTDLQAQMMALMCLSNGSATITETIFENRFMHVAELCRMGADIQIHGHCATVKGVDQLIGAEVMATDLRASVSLVLAALAAEGTTTIHRVYHIDRGYEYIESKLKKCRATIDRIK